MQLPADVLNDLITLYAAGEASPGTRAIVEAALKADPSLASRLDAPLPAAPAVTAPVDPCLKSLRAAKRMHLVRMFLLGFGLVTLLVPLHPMFWTRGDRAGRTFIAVSESVSATAWGLFVVYSQRIRRTGLR